MNSETMIAGFRSESDLKTRRYGNVKEVSVIVASSSASTTIEECLTSLMRQNVDELAEIIVVDSSANGASNTLVAQLPEVQWIQLDPGRLVPELWAHGASHAVGEILAFTTASFVPAEDWVSEVLAQLSADYAAVGGAIEQSEPAPLSRWAVYFCRYASYMLPFQPHEATQIPGDNAVYKRWVLEEYAPMIREGFWEYEINRRLVADGHTLFLNPSMRMHHLTSSGAVAFCRERFVHGRLFGGKRRARASFVKRLAFVVSLPLIPAIQLANMGREVISRGRHQREYLLAMPWIVLFVSCWSLGEYLGYLFGGGQREGAWL